MSCLPWNKIRPSTFSCVYRSQEVGQLDFQCFGVRWLLGRFHSSLTWIILTRLSTLFDLHVSKTLVSPRLSWHSTLARSVLGSVSCFGAVPCIHRMHPSTSLRTLSCRTPSCLSFRFGSCRATKKRTCCDVRHEQFRSRGASTLQIHRMPAWTAVFTVFVRSREVAAISWADLAGKKRRKVSMERRCAIATIPG